jgi:SAM-dependent methyltransferase
MGQTEIMRDNIWENLVALNSQADPVLDALPSAQDHLNIRAGLVAWDEARIPLEMALKRDPFPLPTTANREGYHGNHHFDYWASGLRDMQMLMDCAEKYATPVQRYLDIGCASGRLVRHAACQYRDMQVYGCDINRKHVDWVNRFLPRQIVAFQNHSLPHLNLPDASTDLVSAYSVFTHVESWDVAWLMEIARIMRPGAIAWITFHSELTWSEMAPQWPLHQQMKKYPDFAQLQGNDLPHDVFVFRGNASRSYSSQVFYKTSYVKDIWSRVMPLREIRRRCPGYQDVAIFRKE